MRNAVRLLTAHLAALTLIGCAVRQPPQQPDPPAPLVTVPVPAPTPPLPANAVFLSDHTVLLAPIQVDSLTVTPIESTRDGSDAGSDFTVLDEAMPKHLVTIREKPNKEVNALVLTNKSDQPLFLMGGEVIIGGEQDRIIGRNTIIPPNTTQDVPVFCVEHGRWSGDSKEFTSAKALAHGRLRGKANFEDQGQVWNEVAAKNEERKTTSSTDTYRKVAAQQSDGTLGTMEKQVDSAIAKLPDADRAKLVGFAVALNGAVASVDVFESPALFAKLENKLLHSYMTEAVDIAADKTAKPPSAADVKAFMADVDKAPPAPSYATPAADTEVSSSHVAAKATVRYKPSKKAAPEANPAPATAKPADTDDVYEGYQRK
jgi:hypothetical protein